MNKYYLILLSLLLPFSSQALHQANNLPPVQAANLPYTQTSILQLMAHPERYYDRNIRVSGYYINWLGLTLSHDRYLQSEFVVEVMTDDPELTYDVCDTNWVELEGHFLPTFDQEHRRTVGRIIVDRLTVKESGEICWQRTEPFQFPLVSN